MSTYGQGRINPLGGPRQTKFGGPHGKWVPHINRLDITESRILNKGPGGGREERISDQQVRLIYKKKTSWELLWN